MTIDSTLNVIVGAIVPFLMALVGIWLSLEALQSRKHKIVSVTAFGFLFCVGVLAVGWEARRAEKAQQQRDNSITSLNGQLNIMAQWVLHPPMESELRKFLADVRQASGSVPSGHKSPTDRPLVRAPLPSRSQPIAITQTPSTIVAPAEGTSDGDMGKFTSQQLKSNVAAFAQKLREFEAAFQMKDQEIALNQPMKIHDSGDADLDHALQQLAIQRLQRTSDYEVEFRKRYLPEALQLQAELIRRTPPTQFPDLAPLALTFGGTQIGFPLPSSNLAFLGLRPLGDVADYLERLANKVPE